jgi:hypothetical protein
MDWKTPECVWCKQKIGRPKDAIYLSFSLKGDSFAHIGCYTKQMQGFAGDMGSVGTGAAVLSGSGIGVLSIKNTAGDIRHDMESGNREIIQKRAAKNFAYGIGGGAIMVILGAFALWAVSKKGGWETLAAGAALFLIGLAVLGTNIVAVLHRAEFEKLVAK